MWDRDLDMLVRYTGRREDTGIDVRHSEIPNVDGPFDILGGVATTDVDARLIAAVPRRSAFEFVKARHGDGSVDLIDGKISVVTAATFCEGIGSAC